MDNIDKQLENVGAIVAHHFSGGVYAKETRIPKGVTLAQHSHPHDHMSILVRGLVRITVDGITKAYMAPRVIDMPANMAHKVQAVSDVVWVCLWSVDETDPSKVDAVIMGDS